jgi:hypothetical protein
MSYGALGVGLAMLLPGIYFWQDLTGPEWLMLASLNPNRRKPI